MFGLLGALFSLGGAGSAPTTSGTTATYYIYGF